MMCCVYSYLSLAANEHWVYNVSTSRLMEMAAEEQVCVCVCLKWGKSNQ